MSQRIIFWPGINPALVSKIGSSDGSLACLDVGSTILLRSEAGEAERTIIALRVDGPYIETFLAPITRPNLMKRSDTADS